MLYATKNFRGPPGFTRFFETGDASFHFYAWYPCPADAKGRGNGGCERDCEHLSVRLVRWQLIAVVDARWKFCPAFDIVDGSAGVSRARHVTALIGRAMSGMAQPQLWRLGRHLWSSPTLRRALDRCSLRVQPLRQKKQKSAAGDFFDRLRMPASLIPGHLGRDRRHARTVIALAHACQAGRADPREHFLPLESAVARLTDCVQFANTEPVASPAGWGCWIPWERFGLELKEHPPARLHDSNLHFFAREQRLWTVRHGAVGGIVNCAGLRFPMVFPCESLRQFTGCRVRVCFDPLAEYITATLVLPAAGRGYRAGHIIARHVPALEFASPISAARRSLARILRAGTWSSHRQ